MVATTVASPASAPVVHRGPRLVRSRGAAHRLNNGAETARGYWLRAVRRVERTSFIVRRRTIVSTLSSFLSCCFYANRSEQRCTLQRDDLPGPLSQRARRLSPSLPLRRLSLRQTSTDPPPRRKIESSSLSLANCLYVDVNSHLITWERPRDGAPASDIHI